MKGGFEFIPLFLFQVLDSGDDLVWWSPAKHLLRMSIERHDAHFANSAVAHAGQDNRHDPQFLAAQRQMPRRAGETAKRVLADQMAVGRDHDFLGIGAIAKGTYCRPLAVPGLPGGCSLPRMSIFGGHRRYSVYDSDSFLGE
jgi:hypothetical protein